MKKIYLAEVARLTEKCLGGAETVNHRYIECMKLLDTGKLIGGDFPRPLANQVLLAYTSRAFLGHILAQNDAAIGEIMCSLDEKFKPSEYIEGEHYSTQASIIIHLALVLPLRRILLTDYIDDDDYFDWNNYKSNIYSTLFKSIQTALLKPNKANKECITQIFQAHCSVFSHEKFPGTLTEGQINEIVGDAKKAIKATLAQEKTASSDGFAEAHTGAAVAPTTFSP